MRIKLPFLFLLFASSAFGQGIIAPPKNVTSTVNGIMRPLANATITVCAAGASGIPCSPTISNAIFKDAGLTQPLSNPFATDANGNYQFAAAPGTYTVTETAAGFAGYSYQLQLPSSCVPAGSCATVAGNNAFTGSNNFSGNNTHSGTETFTGPVVVSNASSTFAGTATNGATAGNIGLRPANTDQVRYVTNSGNDSNDGLSWGTAKLTIAAACASITNQDSTCLKILGTGIIYISPTFSGTIPSGFFSGQATALDIIGPGYLQGDSSVTSAKGTIGSFANEAYLFLYDGGFATAIQAGPRGKECFPITATSVASNVMTVTCTNTVSPADVVFLSGTQESFLNGQKVTVSTSSGTQFTAPFTTANYTNSTDTGVGAEKTSLAANTLTTPDLSGGTSTPAPGVLLGITATGDSTAGGHCLFYNGGTATTGLSGLMVDSGINCNGNITFPTNAHFLTWTNGANQVALTAAAATGNRVPSLPDMTGGVSLGFQCGTIAANGACSNSTTNFEHCVSGIATLSAGTSTITGISPAFTSSSTFYVVTNDITTIANPSKGAPASASSITFTGTGTDNIQFIACGG